MLYNREYQYRTFNNKGDTMQKILANIRDQHNKGIFTAEEAVQKTISTMNHFNCSFPDLDEWCATINKTIDNFDRAHDAYKKAIKSREETFKTLWALINK